MFSSKTKSGYFGGLAEGFFGSDLAAYPTILGSREIGPNANLGAIFFVRPGRQPENAATGPCARPVGQLGDGPPADLTRASTASALASPYG
jgi:hypothetical protein